jgi:hypothetical protein
MEALKNAKNGKIENIAGSVSLWPIKVTVYAQKHRIKYNSSFKH